MAPKKNEKRWIVKDAEGRIFGPFSTEQVLEQIDRNYFLGGEQVASYPGGDWTPISKAPEFYDRLLDVLAEEVKGGAAAAAKPAHSSMHEANSAPKTRSVSPSVSALPVAHSVTTPSALSDANSATATDRYTKSSSGQVIELTDLKKIDRLQQLKQSRLPLILIVIALLAVGAMLITPDGPVGDKRIRLLTPRKNQGALAADKLIEKFRRAIGFFQVDTFKGYLRAENELIEVIEGASPRIEDGQKKAEYLSFLCLTYRELWPFAYQDAKDMKAVSEAMQEAKRIDPGGLHGSICELVHLMLNGRIRDAQGLSEAVLIEKSQSPVLYEIRGDLFAKIKDHQNAANYFGHGRELWAGWQKSTVEEARSRAELKQYSAAADLYRGVLQKVPDHGVAKIELGLIEGVQFNQYEKAINLITTGVDQNVSRTIAARGYLGLAQIYLRKQQNKRAQTAAKKAFELDPTSHEAKAFLESIGVSPHVSRDETDLMFLCEKLMQEGDFYSAQAQCKAAFDANKKNGMAAMKAGKCLWQLNQSTDAIDWMRKAVRADPRLIAAYVELADYYAQRFDYFSAMEVLRQAQAIQPSGFELMRGFATVEFRRNNFKGAIGFGQRALKLYETDIETLLLMAKSFAGLQRYPEAQKYAARVIDLDYNNIEGHSIYARIEAGLHGVDSGANYVQQMLNKYVITQGRQVPQAAIDLRITMGEIYMLDERYKQAEDLYRQAIGLDPNSKRALIALGKVLQAQNQASLALEFFLKAAVLDPSDAEPIYASGMLYADTGKLNEAAKQFERVLKINFRYPKAHSALGRVALKRGDTKKALEEALQERTMNPDLADSYTLAAEAYFNMHQYSNCAAEYQKAIQRAGQGTVILVRMARCYRLAGALEAAQSLLRQAISIESGNPEIYKEQGAIFHMRGVPDEAIGSYETYLRLAPNAADRAEVEGRIRKVQAGDMTIRE